MLFRSRAPPHHVHGDLTSLAPHESLPEIFVVWTLTVSALSGETKSKPALREPASELESHLTAVPGASATAEQGEMCERCSETRWGLHPDPPIYQVERVEKFGFRQAEI